MSIFRYGYAADPSASVANNIVGDLEALKRNDGLSVYNLPQREHKKRKHDLKTAQMEENGEEEDNGEEIENPASEEWLRKNRKSPWAGKKEGLQSELTEEQKKYAEEHAEKKGEKEKGEKEVFADKTTFHGKEE